MMYYLLLFRDPGEKLTGGICIVKAQTLDGAIKESRVRDINPGGEVAGYPLTQSQFEYKGLILNFLYTREELQAIGYDFKGCE